MKLTKTKTTGVRAQKYILNMKTKYLLNDIDMKFMYIFLKNK